MLFHCLVQIIFFQENVVFSLFFHLLSVPAEEHGPLTPEEVINQVTRKHGKKTILWTFDGEG